MNRFFQNFLKLTGASLKLTPIHYHPIYPFASFKEKMEQRNWKKAVAEFKNEIEYLASKPTYTLVDYKQRVIDSLNKMQKGIRAKLLAGNEQSEASLVNQRKVLNAMTDEELLDEKTLDSTAKKEISIITQGTVQDVNMIIKNFDYMKSIHTWLRSLKERNEPLPENEEEMSYLFRKDRPIKKSDYFKMNNRQPQWSKKKLRQRIKWGPRKKV